MPPTRTAAKLLATLALALVGAGCDHTTVARDGQVQMSITEYRLVPQSIRTPAGALTIYVHNYGRLAHNLVVMRGTATWGSTEPIRPGQSAELTVGLHPGKYLMSSTILSDRDLGIYGTLTVTS
jgi:plastocyanin